MDTNTLYKVHVSPVTHYYAVLEPSNNTGWYKYYTQKRARGAHPHVDTIVSLSETEWLAAIHKRALPVVLNEGAAVASAGESDGDLMIDGELLYLVCCGCGEAFETDEPSVAYQHWNNECPKTLENWDTPIFEIKVESEAF
jgi:hypothetical protein